MVIKIYRSGNYVLALNNANSAQLFRVLSRNILATNFSGQVRISNVLTGQVFSTEAFGDYIKQDNSPYGANIIDTINALNAMLGFNAGTGTGGSGGSGGGGGGVETIPVASQAIWANKFDKNYVVGTTSAPITGNINAPDLVGAVEGATVEIYWQDSTKANFLSELYRRTDGMDTSINTLNRIILTYKGGVVHVEGARVLSVGTASPTITGAATLNVGDVVAVSVIGAAGTTYQWQRLSGTWGNIAGATNSSYTVQVADATNQIRCQVVYKEDGFQGALVTTPAKSCNAVATKTSIIAGTTAAFSSMTPNATTGGNITLINHGNTATGSVSSPTTPTDWAVMFGLQTTGGSNQRVFSLRNTGGNGYIDFLVRSADNQDHELFINQTDNTLVFIVNDVTQNIFDNVYRQVFIRRVGSTYEMYVDNFVTPVRTATRNDNAVDINRFDVRNKGGGNNLASMGANSYIAYWQGANIPALSVIQSIAAANHS